jgi:hypothetical protein
MPKPRKRSKPLTISIHGDGIAIDAKIDNASTMSTVVAQLAAHLQPQTPGPTQAPDTGHDFDAAERVVKHGSLEVVEALSVIVTAELERRRASA